MNYIDSQFKRLYHPDSGILADQWDSAKLKLHTQYGETNWLNVTPEQIEAIKQILLKG